MEETEYWKTLCALKLHTLTVSDVETRPHPNERANESDPFEEGVDFQDLNGTSVAPALRVGSLTRSEYISIFDDVRQGKKQAGDFVTYLRDDAAPHRFSSETRRRLADRIECWLHHDTLYEPPGQVETAPAPDADFNRPVRVC